MYMDYNSRLEKLISNALDEDIGTGDHSTLSIFHKNEIGRAILKVKEECVISGVMVAKKIFHHLDNNVVFNLLAKDGIHVHCGDVAFEITANIQAILSAERLVLNCMQRMSGISTLTRLYVNKLNGFRTKLLDTRKTTPNFRLLEKEAVRIGGGLNHRFGLFDMIMLKDNHIDYAGGIENAINYANRYIKDKELNIKIEIEARNLMDVEIIMTTGKISRIMLDNFTPALLKEALILIDGKYETEASGGINLQNLEEFAATGVDYISSGAVIHQAKSVDLSLKAQIN